MFANAFNIFIESIVTGPKYQIHIFAFGISHEGFQVDFGYNLKQIVFQIYSPSLVEDYIFNTIFGCKIDIIFVGWIVYPGFEIHIV
ncbi:hypothetical protein SDC9_194799 [bioreactor metagenome]|uniref:Uncharacterized protein n=1 Tax=bioreactor metagenome TaxID=1076179 RepID=A0A645I7G4_9ZZZZ